jgi:hypothetical protein
MADKGSKELLSIARFAAVPTSRQPMNRGLPDRSFPSTSGAEYPPLDQSDLTFPLAGGRFPLFFLRYSLALNPDFSCQTTRDL